MLYGLGLTPLQGMLDGIDPKPGRRLTDSPGPGKHFAYDGPADLRDRDHLWLAYHAGWSRLVLNL